MSAARLTLPPALAQRRTQLQQYWRTRAPRERLALTLMAVVLVVALAWLLFVQPAWSSLRQTPQQIDQLDAQLQQMQRLAAEAQALRGVAAVSTAQATAALRAATERLGDKGRLSLLGDRATLTLNGAPPEALRGWLIEARSAARARPVEAQLTRAGNGYSGSLVVQLSGGATP
ncbi:MAG: type II secretion system protein M [Piscinibacter sp.]|nr:type II secretion system protein M [Piscinibacter sp.]